MNYIVYRYRKWGSRGYYLIEVFGQSILVKGKRNLNAVIKAFEILKFKDATGDKYILYV